MIESGELIQLVSPKGKRYLRIADPDDVLHTHDGRLELSSVFGIEFGQSVQTHLGRPYRVIKPTIHDLIKNVERRTQIIYPKDIGYIVLKLGVGPGSVIVEAGGGSGSLTLALAWFVGKEGMVHSFERREQFRDLCRKNLERVGLQDRVTLHLRDIEQGFGLPEEAQSLFMDVRTPWDYLEQIPPAVRNGAPVGFLLPTTNQVADLLAAMEGLPFTDQEVVELLLRRYKPVADRVRPEDRMVAHTGYLLFARVQK
jgi:tRNA (adenine57-N1/adenine58-N1)-methyltransferase